MTISIQPIAAYYVLVAHDQERQNRTHPPYQVTVTRPSLAARVASAAASLVRPSIRATARPT
jgi:hypothetical protein